MNKSNLLQMRVILNTTSGSTVSVDVLPDETYRQLRDRVHKESGEDLDISQIYYNGNKVDEDHNVYKTFFGATAAKVQQVSCAVKGCTTTTDKEFFRFPNESERCTQWILACHRRDLLGRSAEMINANLGVCADHFSEKCFLDGHSRRRLRKGSVPEVEDPEKSDREGLINTLEEGDENLLESETVTVAKDEFGVTYVITQNLDADEGDSGLLKPKEEVISHSVLDSESKVHQVIEGANSNHIRETDDDQVNRNKESERLVEEFESDDPLNNEDIDNDEEDDIVLEHPGLLCRLCAKQVADAHFIFNGNGQETPLAKKINFSLPVKVNNSDHLPKQLCSDCVSMVEVCHNFSLACVQAESDLKLLAKRKQFRCKTKQTNELAIISGDLNSNIKAEVEKGIEDSCYDCPLCCDGRMSNHNRNDDNESQISDTVDAEPIPEDDDGSTACAVCAVTFGSIETLMEHARSHTLDSDSRFPCGCCGGLLGSEEDVSIHLQLHNNPTGEAQYQCGDCGQLFESEDRAEFHHECGHRQDGDNYLLTCTMCELSFLHEDDLWEHSQTNHRSFKAHSCETCGKSFVMFTRLKAHLRTHAYEYMMECDDCDEKFSDNATLKAHVTSVHSDKKAFQCDFCGRCYTRKAQYNAHLRTHGIEGNVEKKPRAYTCRLCGEEGFETLPKLLLHRRQEHQDSIVPLGVKKEKMYKCGECDKAFTGRVALKHHMMNHTGELPHVCEFCNKGFTQKRSLILHRRTHTGEKPYGCQECGKRFVQSAHLYSHLRLHTGEKPYSCSECDATFRLKDVRDSHQRKHTGERPFKCKVCGKTFRTSHSYYQHTWIHTGRKPYPCNYCGKAFRRSNGLKVHIRIHTGEKPHVCDVCGRGFAQKQDMKKHRNLHVVGKL